MEQKVRQLPLRQPLLWILVLIGLNMRPLLTSVGPLLPLLREETGMSSALVALLTSLPMLMMGLLALAGGWVDRLLQERHSIMLGLLAIALGAFWRELAPDNISLLCSALLGGLGIGLVQTVVPGVIKHHFLKQVTIVTGLWSAALMGGGGLGALLTPWLASETESWRSALAWWGWPAVLALVGWWPVSRMQRSAPRLPQEERGSLFRNRRAWLLGLYFGLLNGGYTSLIAWLPPFYMQLGWPAQESGALLALMTVGQVVGALLLPTLARGRDRRPLLMLALLLQILGFLGLLLQPVLAPWCWVLLLGFGLGGAFPLCLVLALEHIPQPAQAGRLVAFMQGIGFLLAAIAPYLSGMLLDISGGFTLDWLLHAVLLAGALLMTRRFHPDSYLHAFPARGQISGSGDYTQSN